MTLLFIILGFLFGMFILNTIKDEKKFGESMNPEPCKLHSWVYINEETEMICEKCNKTPGQLLNEHAGNGHGMY